MGEFLVESVTQFTVGWQLDTSPGEHPWERSDLLTTMCRALDGLSSEIDLGE